MTDGLTSQEARERLARDGPNDIEPSRRSGFAALVRNVAHEPMFLLLLAAAALYLLIGELSEGLLLGGFAVVTVGLVIVQQRRGDRALDALRALAVPYVRVLRDNQWVRVPAAEVVAGDAMLIGEGERIAADVQLRECTALECDESLLTGESVSVPKQVGDAAYAGTLVVAGHGVAQVQATGLRTRMGAIGASLERIDLAPTPLQQTLARVTRWLAVLAFILSVLLAVWLGIGSRNWLQGALAGIAFGMSMLPEEIPMVLTVFLAFGAWRMASVKVLARRPAAIEALGAATVLCVDKTGTLTENRMKLVGIVLPGSPAAHDPIDDALPVRTALLCAMLASRRGTLDPIDRAILGTGEGLLHQHWALAREYPMTPKLPAMAQAWLRADGTVEVAAKGAPEAIASICRLSADEGSRLHRQVEELANRGLRILAVARAIAPRSEALPSLHELDFSLLGLLAFEDPLRADVPDAVATARKGGIEVAMITGDHAATARAIARQAGIDTSAGVMTGDALEALDDQALARVTRRVRVFARVTPLQKLRLVKAFQANGETVAMTGDGVNDAPSLKAAHVGIAMGVRGTDVAREAAGLVLLDEDFTRIVDGVRLGRRIDDNLRKAIFYIVAIHVPIAGLAFVPVMLGMPVLMLPIHVVLTEMVIDPLCSFAFEGVPEAQSLMSRRPRPRDAHAFRWQSLRGGLVAGLLLLLSVLGVWGIALANGGTADEARTLAVCALTVGNLSLVWMLARPQGARSAFASWPLVIVTAVSVMVMTAGVLLPGARELLRFAPVNGPGLLAAMALGIAAAVGGGLVAVRTQRMDLPGENSLVDLAQARH
ncbi:cation-translocating P-type ATPase [Variovorax sp. Sphag1AA]|uniref:cation-translocating P-type ATPase n=1 Tax=Variovorax sp. Sphag1AA TaxID=2587027 RepID=UPI0016106CA7|nr:cation-translocating P-type ATPase [Variovorax sp. Sphag1AA]MBB3181961.1 Ca2+-transporting ATPase [Variovorax sp. Sphag1AA]